MNLLIQNYFETNLRFSHKQTENKVYPGRLTEDFSCLPTRQGLNWLPVNDFVGFSPYDNHHYLFSLEAVVTTTEII